MQHESRQRLALSVLLSVLFTVGIGIGSYLVRAIDANTDRLISHELSPGHPVTITRLDQIQRDIAEIKETLRMMSKGAAWKSELPTKHEGAS